MLNQDNVPHSPKVEGKPAKSEEVLSLINVLPPPESLKADSRPAKKNEVADAAVDKVLLKLVKGLLPELQRHLDSLQGKDFGRERNVELARNLNRVLSRLGCEVACPKCGEAATAIRYLDMSRPGNWLWRFEHTPARRHGGTVAIPLFKVRLKSPDIAE
jgi:hypothetical protein